MEASKPSMRTRKVVNYVAMNGDGSDDSEDDKVNPVNIKVAVPIATVSKPSKLSKLKLRTRREPKVPKCDDIKLTKSKPVLDDVAPMKPSVTPPCLTSNTEDIELSIAEPELIIHSIFSQETVITSTCECLSPHEFTDSSESDTYSSTVEITSAQEDAKLNIKLSPALSKTNGNRIIKRRIINENLSKQKKIKIDIEKMTHHNTFPVDKLSVPKPAEDVFAVPPQVSRLPSSWLGKDKSSPKHSVPPHQHLAAPLLAHDEVSIFQEDSMHSPVQPTNQLLKEDYTSETEHASRGLTLKVVTISEKSGSKGNSLEPALLAPKSVKRKTGEECTRKIEARNNTVATSKLRDSLPNSMVSGGRRKNIPTSPIVTGEQNAEASPSANGDTKGLDTSHNVTSLPYPVNKLKPRSPQTKKLAVKWKPPGKAGGTNNPLGGNSPAIGIRLGLSRNRRASKPLHPDLKVKI